MLLECDRIGQILWMSDNAREAFGKVENLANALLAPMANGDLLQDRATFSISRIYQAEGRYLLSLQREESTKYAEKVDLVGLEDRFRYHYNRLDGRERELAARTQKRRPSGRTIIRQIERERQRLGRDLHTGVGQMLVAIRLQLETIDKALSNPTEQVRQALNRISTLAGDALEQVRSVSLMLHPPEWQRLTIDTALGELWVISGIPQQFQARLRLDPLPRDPDPEVKALLYRAAQEGLSNLSRHSRATQVDLSLESRTTEVVLTVSDNGVGFDAKERLSAPASIASGLGLRSIRQQAAALGGKLEIVSGPKGTTLRVLAPFTTE